MDKLADLYAEQSQCCTKQKLRMWVNLRNFVSQTRGISKKASSFAGSDAIDR